MLWNLLLHQTDVIVHILLLIVDGSSLLSWSRVCYQIHSSTDEFTYNTYKQTNPCQQESSTFLDMCSNPQLKSFVSFFTNWPFFKFLLLPLSESRLPAAAHMFPLLLLTIVSFTAFVAADCDKWKQSIKAAKSSVLVDVACSQLIHAFHFLPGVFRTIKGWRAHLKFLWLLLALRSR